MSLTPRLDSIGRNRCINGCMEYWQRGISLASSVMSGNFYLADRFETPFSGSMAFTAQRSTDVPTVTDGYKPLYSLHIDTTTATASPASADYCFIRQHLEGYFVRDLIGKDVTLSFYVKSPKSGAHYVSVRNGTNVASISLPYTVTAANTWEKVVLNFNISALYPYSSTTSTGLQIIFPLVAGSSTKSPSDSVWSGTVYVSGPNQQNLMDNTANDFKVTSISLIEGTHSDPVYCLAGSNIMSELLLCQRYYERMVPEPATGYPATGFAPLGRIYNNAATTANIGFCISFKSFKRANPTVRFYYDLNDGASVDAAATVSSVGGASLSVSVPAGQFMDLNDFYASAEL